MKFRPLVLLTFILYRIETALVHTEVLKPSKCNTAGSTRSLVNRKNEEKKFNLIQNLDLLSHGLKREGIPEDPDCIKSTKRDDTNIDILNSHVEETLLPSDATVEPIDGAGASAVPGTKKYEIVKFPNIIDEEDTARAKGRGISATLMQHGKGVVRSSLFRPQGLSKLNKLTFEKKAETPLSNTSKADTAQNSSFLVPPSQSTPTLNTSENANNTSENTNSTLTEKESPTMMNSNAESLQQSRLVTNVIKNTSHLLTIEERVEDAEDVIGSKRSMNKFLNPKLRKQATVRTQSPLPKKLTPDDVPNVTPPPAKRTSSIVGNDLSPGTERKPINTNLLSLTEGQKNSITQGIEGNSTHVFQGNDSTSERRNSHFQGHIASSKPQIGTIKSIGNGVSSSGSTKSASTSSGISTSKETTTSSKQATTSNTQNSKPSTDSSHGAGAASSPSGKTAASLSTAEQPQSSLPAPFHLAPDPYAEIANGPDSPKLPELKTSGEGVNSPLMKVDTENGALHPIAQSKTDSAPSTPETSTASVPPPPSSGPAPAQTEVGGLLDSLTDKLNAGTGADGLPPPPPEAIDQESHSQATPQQDVGGLLDTLTDKLNLGDLQKNLAPSPIRADPLSELQKNLASPSTRADPLSGNIATDQPIPSPEAKYLQDQLNQYDQQAIMQAQGFNSDKSAKDGKASDLTSPSDTDGMFSKAVSSIHTPTTGGPVSSSATTATNKNWGDINSLDSLNAEATREEPNVGDTYANDIDSYGAAQSPQVSDAIGQTSLSPSSYSQQGVLNPSTYSRQTLDAATADDVSYEQQITGGAYNGATFESSDAQGLDTASPQENFANSYPAQYLRRSTIFRPEKYDIENLPDYTDHYVDYM